MWGPQLVALPAPMRHARNMLGGRTANWLACIRCKRAISRVGNWCDLYIEARHGDMRL